MTIFQSAILGVIQGLTEFLPISSSGHLIIARRFFDLDFAQSLSFDVFLHLATLLAIVICFKGDILRLVKDLFTWGPSARSKNLFWAIVLGTLPAALAGYFWGSALEEIIRTPQYVAYALIAGSIVFFFADQIPKGEEGGISKLKGLFIGIFQMFALVPGISRSGITISGGLFFGLSREEAIRFAFLLAIPAILGAGVQTIFGSGVGGISLNDPTVWVGFVASFLSGLWAIRFLVRYLAKHSFTPFIIYRLLLAGAILFFL